MEIYNSWYALFGRVRQLISDIPGHMLRREKSTQELVRVATQTLNNCLRPHLTRWQARFRHWYDSWPDAVKEKCPQDCQREFPQYAKLVADIKTVNGRLKVLPQLTPQNPDSETALTSFVESQAQLLETLLSTAGLAIDKVRIKSPVYARISCAASAE